MLEQRTLGVFLEAAKKLDAGFAGLPALEGGAAGIERVAEVLNATAERLQDNYPYFHPLYAGQMLKPPHAVARLAYALAMWINPNNHALDGGRATSAMEKEAVAEIAAMFGWKNFLGHLCGGGTMANLEALWVAGQLQPGKKILASEQAHYTHKRITGVLQLEFETVACDARGRMDIEALAKNLQQDAARGFSRIGEADSIVIDPHKHGLQPYGCGCVLFRDSGVGRLYKHDSPYTYFSSAELHLGEISLECSRPGAAAAALWATQRLLPLKKHGEFARGLERGRKSALALFDKLKADSRFVTAFTPELDILVFAPRGESVSESSEMSRKIFEAAAKGNLHLAVAELPVHFWEKDLGLMKRDRDRLTCLRSVLMKPEHYDWVERIWELLSEAASEVFRTSAGGRAKESR